MWGCKMYRTPFPWCLTSTEVQPQTHKLRVAGVATTSQVAIACGGIALPTVGSMDTVTLWPSTCVTILFIVSCLLMADRASDMNPVSLLHKIDALTMLDNKTTCYEIMQYCQSTSNVHLEFP